VIDAAPTVLLIEDDPQIRRFLRATLPAHGFRLPDMDGVEAIRRIREWPSLPILVLSARGLERDKFAALDSGADDYLTKPFGVDELLARLRVALRHAAAAAGPSGRPYVAGDLEVDLLARKVRLAGKEIHLTPTEFKLLALLVRHAGKVVTHRQLLTEVWGPGAAGNTHYLRVQMHSLRHKLEAIPARPEYLTTETGVGYRLPEPSSD
jgi:two-component system KDP operon response regulator KdpE